MVYPTYSVYITKDTVTDLPMCIKFPFPIGAVWMKYRRATLHKIHLNLVICNKYVYSFMDIGTKAYTL